MIYPGQHIRGHGGGTTRKKRGVWQYRMPWYQSKGEPEPKWIGSFPSQFRAERELDKAIEKAKQT